MDGKPSLARGLSGSALFVLVLAFFFLPWMSISCLDEEVLTVSGADMMGITEIDDIPSDVGDDDYGIGDALGSEAALLYLAALLAVAGAALFFLPGRRGSYTRAGHSRSGHCVHIGLPVSDVLLDCVGGGSGHRRA